MAKSFRLAAARSLDGEVVEKLDFTIDGTEETLYAYPPSEGQLVLLTAASGARQQQRQISEFMDVFWSLVDEDTENILRDRLSDPYDTFGVQDILNIIEWLSEEAAARPTQPSSGSTPSQRSDGTRSTAPARRRASTRSPSRQIGSAT